MTITKAIKIHQHLDSGCDPDECADAKRALKLGIEALKYRLQLEEEDADITLEPLPGETKED